MGLPYLRQMQQNQKRFVKLSEGRRIYWTEAETKALIKWVNVFGKDYKQIAKRIKTKSLQQIKSKVFRHAGGPGSYGEVLFPDLQRRTFKHWTSDEDRAFWRVIEKHGLNFQELQKAIPNRGYGSISGKVRYWYKEIKANPKHERRHLLKTLWRPRMMFYWTDEEL